MDKSNVNIKFKKYLYTNRLSAREFATRAKMNYRTVMRVLANRPVRSDSIRRVVEGTNGAIKKQDIVKDWRTDKIGEV